MHAQYRVHQGRDNQQSVFCTFFLWMQMPVLGTTLQSSLEISSPDKPPQLKPQSLRKWKAEWATSPEEEEGGVYAKKEVPVRSEEKLTTVGLARLNSTRMLFCCRYCHNLLCMHIMHTFSMPLACILWFLGVIYGFCECFMISASVLWFPRVFYDFLK